MTRYILLVWLCIYNHQCPPWSVIIFRHTVFIHPYQKLAKYPELMQAAYGWFEADMWMITCVNIHFFLTYRTEKYVLPEHY